MNTSSLLDTAYKRSIQKLLVNTTENGLLAAAPKSLEGDAKHYTSLFSRDIGVSSLGILASGDTKLKLIIERSLANLASAQSSRGQLPFHIQPEQHLVQWWMPETIYRTYWWGIAMLMH